MRPTASLASLVLLLSTSLAAQPARRAPTVDDLLGMSTLAGAAISPDGKWVAYGVTTADTKQNAYVTRLWVADVATGARRQLTSGDRSVGAYRWSPDSRWIGFTSDRVGGRSQLFAIHPDGGEAVQLTDAEAGVQGYAWSPDGRTVAFTSAPPPDTVKARRERYGDYEVVRTEYAYAHLFTADVDSAMAGLAAPRKGRQRTRGTTMSVQGFEWSPDGTRIAFAATTNPDLVQGATADIYVLSLGDDRVRRVVSQPGPDGDPHWSPDGRSLVITSAMGQDRYFARLSRLAVVPADAEGATPRSITDGVDEDAAFVAWRPEGIYFAASERTASHLFRVDPATARVTRVSAPNDFMGGAWTVSATGRAATIVSSPTALPEVAVVDLAGRGPFAPRTLTAMSDQVRGLALGTRELITWKSQDGATIEGVLVKPAGWAPNEKRPLLVVIHGGPTGIDRPTLMDTRNYPVDVFAARGALVLKVNYRGSSGYGAAFRRLNERNLGVGDAWDVLSGVDTLIARGWVDSTRMGAMGWSQGGYISAFLTTTTTRFKAISVGAGISDWATYYYNTDITPFTINYLGADPVADAEIYRKTSPISYAMGAKTPTLIQHGELDRRVPIANAYELRQALVDRGVPVEMVVYKGFGHGVTKPREQRAVMEHNLAWFGHWVFGDSASDVRAVLTSGGQGAQSDATRQP
ncbi:WD40-like beta Propeller containing protein [Gemmatirosa kalamazoonensis]|uniref:WD40-like beta Propeller containing protein n=1 Tax=Gemmatirosa kalamazoonensis TaxID=861299 RepID=W0RCK7_9BACT|nr:S9 family peptidase [Gemmatirosa kalamazoonensis]AHG88526.1 WD40-like beta Propeller containing protein [Gemmatirosa kalamazoonensis]